MLEELSYKDKDFFSAWNISTTNPIGLIFDVDELLYDNHDEIFAAYKYILQKRNISIKEGERFPGKDLFEVLDGIRKRYNLNEQLDTLVRERREVYISLLKETDKPCMDGVKELFQFIERYRNLLPLRIALTSSSEEAFIAIILKKIFIYCGLPQYCESPENFFFRHNGINASTFWRPGLNKKPSPELYFLTTEKLGLPVKQCIAFEDSKSGLEAARAAGLKVVVVPSKNNMNNFMYLQAHKIDGDCVKMDSLRRFCDILENTFGTVLSKENVKDFCELINFRLPFIFFSEELPYEETFQICKNISKKFSENISENGIQETGYVFVIGLNSEEANVTN